MTPHMNRPFLAAWALWVAAGFFGCGGGEGADADGDTDADTDTGSDLCQGCLIDGECIPEGTRQSNGCDVCAPDVDPDGYIDACANIWEETAFEDFVDGRTDDA